MKQQAIQYVALDVHQATLVVSVRDEQGSITGALTAIAYMREAAMVSDAALVRLDIVDALLAQGQTKQIVDIAARLAVASHGSSSLVIVRRVNPTHNPTEVASRITLRLHDPTNERTARADGTAVSDQEQMVLTAKAERRVSETTGRNPRVFSIRLSAVTSVFRIATICRNWLHAPLLHGMTVL